jgi:DnaJ domain
MGYHSFSVDPRTVLGVGPNASLDEIQDAYRAKSKKHHPDVGGDEWAFRMVVRAYEVLKTTADAPAARRPWESPGAHVAPGGQSPGWTWAGSAPFVGAGAATATAWSDFGESSETSEDDQTGATQAETEQPIADPTELRTVEVELIWTRFELEFKKDRPGSLLPPQKEDDVTLSVCMVVSWPPQDLVDGAVTFSSAGETLRTVIDRFERLRGQKSVVAARSRIEDGRFVGWLSYPDVLTAQDAVLAVRDTFRTRGLAIKLQTRDERIPFDWHSEAHAPVMSQAS